MIPFLAQLPTPSAQSTSDWFAIAFYVVGALGALVVTIYTVMAYHRRQPSLDAQFVAKSEYDAAMAKLADRLSDGAELFATKGEIEKVAKDQKDFGDKLREEIGRRLSGISEKIDQRMDSVKTDLARLFQVSIDAGEQRVTRLEHQIATIDQSRQDDARRLIAEVATLSGEFRQALKEMIKK